MLPLLARVERERIPPEVTRPDPAKPVSGDPVHMTWSIEASDGLFSGLWQSTPGAWRVSYAEWEYVRILAGHSILTDDLGEATHLRAGDSDIIRPGFNGVWTAL